MKYCATNRSFNKLIAGPVFWIVILLGLSCQKQSKDKDIQVDLENTAKQEKTDGILDDEIDLDYSATVLLDFEIDQHRSNLISMVDNSALEKEIKLRAIAFLSEFQFQRPSSLTTFVEEFMPQYMTKLEPDSIESVEIITKTARSTLNYIKDQPLAKKKKIQKEAIEEILKAALETQPMTKEMFESIIKETIQIPGPLSEEAASEVIETLMEYQRLKYPERSNLVANTREKDGLNSDPVAKLELPPLEDPFVFNEAPQKINKDEVALFSLSKKIDFKYHVLLGSSEDCESTPDWKTVREKDRLEIDVSSLSDGIIKACFFWQEPILDDRRTQRIFIKSYSWRKDTTAPSLDDIAPILTNVPFQIDATATDASPLTWEWQQESGPGEISFDDPKNENPVVSASEEGVYELKATVQDILGHTTIKVYQMEWRENHILLNRYPTALGRFEPNPFAIIYDGIEGREIEIYGDENCAEDKIGSAVFAKPFTKITLTFPSFDSYTLRAKYRGSTACTSNAIVMRVGKPLSKVIDVATSYSGFGLLYDDGSVVLEENSSMTALTNYFDPAIDSEVVAIEANQNNYAVIKEDGSAFSWGYDGYTEDISELSTLLGGGMEELYSTADYFGGLKSDGSFVSWPSSTPYDNVAPQLTSGAGSIYDNNQAFAVLKNDGALVVWGNSSWGGDVSSVASSLNSGVTKVTSNNPYAFAALKSNGSVVTWGNATYGGDSTSVASEINSGVIDIVETKGAFAALKSNGSVITWGYGLWGGDSSSVSSDLNAGVTDIYASDRAFAALKNDGSVITWGEATSGGDKGVKAASLDSGVQEIVPTTNAFAALKNDGSAVMWSGTTEHPSLDALLASDVASIEAARYTFLVTKTDDTNVVWSTESYALSLTNALTDGVEALYDLGNNYIGFQEKNGHFLKWETVNFGFLSYHQKQKFLSKVVDVKSTSAALAALTDDGEVFAWGYDVKGGVIENVALPLTGVAKLYANDSSFVVLKTDGSIVTWGGDDPGISFSTVESDLTTGVVEVFPNREAWAALKSDGSLVTWGNSAYSGGDSSSVASSLDSGVVDVKGSYWGFAALKDNGSVVSWGYAAPSFATVASDLDSGVVSITSGTYAFTALKDDGSAVSWGGSSYSDTSAVSSAISSDVVKVVANSEATAVLKSDGSVVAWGSSANGGDTSSVAGSLNSDVVEIFASQRAFAALKSNGSVVVWGHSNYGGDASTVSLDLAVGIKKIYANDYSFVAITNTDKVVAWGNASYGGTFNFDDPNDLNEIKSIYSSERAFAAVDANGKVATWGSAGYGGDHSEVASMLQSGVDRIEALRETFFAIKADGSWIAWGEDSEIFR